MNLKEKRWKYDMEILHLDGMLGEDGEAGTFEVSDPTVDIEEAFIHRCDLSRSAVIKHVAICVKADGYMCKVM